MRPTNDNKWVSPVDFDSNYRPRLDERTVVKTGKFFEARRTRVRVTTACTDALNCPCWISLAGRRSSLLSIGFYETSCTGKTIVAVRLRFEELRMPRKSRREWRFPKKRMREIRVFREAVICQYYIPDMFAVKVQISVLEIVYMFVLIIYNKQTQ